MKNLLLFTDSSWVGLVSRLTIGIILLPHGAQKMLGWFGGYGFTGTMNFFTGNMRLPWIVAFLVIFIEFAGSLFLIAGFAGRVWAISVIILMLGIIFSSHVENGFFMNWFGNQKGEGYEFHLLVIGLAIITVLSGSGKYSVDEYILKNN